MTSPLPSPFAQLLDEVKSFIVRHLVVSEAAVVMITLWVAWTHFAEHTYFKPRLAIISPQPRCGKSTLMQVLEMLTANPVMCSNITTAALFRSISDSKPTVLIDEADTFLSQREEISNIINSGFEASGTVLRCAPKTNDVIRFNVGAPLAIAAIGADTLKASVLDRSILIEMKRKAADQKMAILRRDKPAEAHALRDNLAQFAAANANFIANAPDPVVPDLGSDRAADKFRPLFMTAELAGHDWMIKATEAAAALTAQMTSMEPEGSGIALLRDIKAAFEKTGQSSITSKCLLGELTSVEDGPWTEWQNGRAMSQRQLAQQLSPFRVKPKVIRLGSATARGYSLADFADVFDRYLPTERNSETSE